MCTIELYWLAFVSRENKRYNFYDLVTRRGIPAPVRPALAGLIDRIVIVFKQLMLRPRDSDPRYSSSTPIVYPNYISNSFAPPSPSPPLAALPHSPTGSSYFQSTIKSTKKNATDRIYRIKFNYIASLWRIRRPTTWRGRGTVALFY